MAFRIITLPLMNLHSLTLWARQLQPGFDWGQNSKGKYLSKQRCLQFLLFIDASTLRSLLGQQQVRVAS